MIKNLPTLAITLIDLHFGGISNLTLNTVPGLEKNFNVTVIYFGPNEDMLDRFVSAGIVVKRIPYNGGKDILKAVLGLKSFIIENKVDIVSTNFTPDKLIVSLTRLFTKFQIVGNIHNSFDPNITPLNTRTWRGRFEEFFHNKISDKVVGVSDCAIENAKKYRNLTNPKLSTIYSGIPGLTSNISIKSKSNKNIFVTACRFVEIKGLDRLIDRFKDVNETHLNWELWIIGNGKLSNSLINKVKTLNLEDKIIFKGYQTNLLSFYKQADFYINSSFNEALGISIIEAMSVGLPILGSKVGGVPEVVTDGYNGYLVDFNDEVASNQKIRLSIDLDNENYRLISENSLNRFKNKFSIEKYCNRISLEYNELLIKN